MGQIHRAITLGLLLFSLAACSLPFKADGIPAHSLLTVTDTPIITEPPYEQCAWVWAQQALPDVTTSFQQHLLDAGISFDEKRTGAYAFGENCLDQNNQVSSFAAMETDFTVASKITSFEDTAALADYAAAVIAIITDQFPPGSIPGSQRGTVDFVFNVDGQDHYLHSDLEMAEALVESDLRGAELYDLLFPTP